MSKSLDFFKDVIEMTQLDGTPMEFHFTLKHEDDES